MLGSKTIACLFMFVAISDFTRPAFAYVDPGSGSVMLQLLFGGAAGVIMLVKLSWEHLIKVACTKKENVVNLFRR
jgi:hypothetical protein